MKTKPLPVWVADYQQQMCQRIDVSSEGPSSGIITKGLCSKRLNLVYCLDSESIL